MSEIAIETLRSYGAIEFSVTALTINIQLLRSDGRGNQNCTKGTSIGHL